MSRKFSEWVVSHTDAKLEECKYLRMKKSCLTRGGRRPRCQLRKTMRFKRARGPRTEPWGTPYLCLYFVVMETHLWCHAWDAKLALVTPWPSAYVLWGGGGFLQFYLLLQCFLSPSSSECKDSSCPVSPAGRHVLSLSEVFCFLSGRLSSTKSLIMKE